MKIEHLFHELKKFTEGKENVFKESGMINCYNKMQYGFFPLGLGVLTENNKMKDGLLTDEVEEGGVMVLGNDFGTVSYVKDVKKDSGVIGEIQSTTIRTILKFIPGLNTYDTFFTNLNLGIRLDDGPYEGTTMTKRICDKKTFRVKPEYSKLCLEFFYRQLELLKPSKVICLGHEVKNGLIDSGGAFHSWKPKSDSLEKLYAKKENSHIIKHTKLNGVEFIVIPHPCYYVNLSKPPYLDKLKDFLNPK